MDAVQEGRTEQERAGGTQNTGDFSEGGKRIEDVLQQLDAHGNIEYLVPDGKSGSIGLNIASLARAEVDGRHGQIVLGDVELATSGLLPAHVDHPAMPRERLNLAGQELVNLVAAHRVRHIRRTTIHGSRCGRHLVTSR